MKINNRQIGTDLLSRLKLWLFSLMAGICMANNALAIGDGEFTLANKTNQQLNCTITLKYQYYVLIKAFSINANRKTWIPLWENWGDFQLINLACNGHQAEYKRDVDIKHFSTAACCKLFSKTRYPQGYDPYSYGLNRVKLDILGQAVSGTNGPCEHSYIGYYTVDSNTGEVAAAKWFFSS